MSKPIKPLTLNQRKELAKIGHPKHLDSLVHDTDPCVKRLVAKFGNDKHRDQLVHDPSWWIKWIVARNGNENHARTLLKDKEETIQREAAERLRELGK